MNLHERIRNTLLESLNRDENDRIGQLNDSLRLLAKWRSVLVQNTLLKHEGTRVLNGPFKGMQFLERSSEGCHIAKLMGCYEQPLFSHIEKAISEDYEVVLNVGSAEGYYAVGMARRMPNCKIFAFDTDRDAQTACVKLAKMNNVADQIEVGGTFKPENFSRFENKRTLFICDIEGAEQELLDPEKFSGLQNLSLIVESHECIRPGITDLLVSRFSPFHSIIKVDDDGSRSFEETPDWFKELAHLDQMLANWEWRSGPTPWLIMKPKTHA